MMGTPVVVMKKLKAGAITGSFCEKSGLGSRSAAACREALTRCQLNSTSKKLSVFIILFRDTDNNFL
jgi:hypothetical protein